MPSSSSRRWGSRSCSIATRARPCFRSTDMPVPGPTVPGEEDRGRRSRSRSSLRPLVRQALTEADLTNITPEARAYALREFKRYASGSIYTPPTLQGTLTQPGHLGGSRMARRVVRSDAERAVCQRQRRAHHQQAAAVYDDAGRGDASGTRARSRDLRAGRVPPATGSSGRASPPLTPALLNLTKSNEEIEAVIVPGP